MELPIYIDDRIEGKVFIYEDGLYKCVRGECRAVPGLMRLYLQGGGKTVYLGLMEPRGKAAQFSKRYTKLQWKSLIKSPERALASELGKRAKPEEKREDEKPFKSPEIKRKIWTELPDGCLWGKIGKLRYLAIPAKISRKIYGIRRIKYKKTEYIVFRY